jgi:hypothetical protein
VPDKDGQWSLMLEVSESRAKPLDPNGIIDDVIQGTLNTGLVSARRDIHHSWYRSEKRGYPTPSLERNQTLFPLLSQLERRGIYSRGRFGGWRYEVGNMDHSLMQGVEFANRTIAAGEELTLWYPQIVNALHPTGKKR